jgi:hypothetical protein
MERYKRLQLIDVAILTALALLPFSVTSMFGLAWPSIKFIGPHPAFEQRTGILVGHIQLNLLIAAIYVYYSYYLIKPTLVAKYKHSLNDPKNRNKSLKEIKAYHINFFVYTSILLFIFGLLIVPWILQSTGPIYKSAYRGLFLCHMSLVLGFCCIREIFFASQFDQIHGKDTFS